MNIFYIYTLLRDGIVFYVGLTKDAEARRKVHCKKDEPTVEMQIVDEYMGEKDTAHALESFYIKKYIDMGFDLLNSKGASGKPNLKQSFTYSGEEKTKRDAMRKAKKEGIKNFSDLVEGLLKAYIGNPEEDSNAASFASLKAFQQSLKKAGQ